MRSEIALRSALRLHAPRVPRGGDGYFTVTRPHMSASAKWGSVVQM